MGVKPTNKRGEPVDPVPFLVVALLAATAVLSLGPVYLLGFDIAYDRAIGVSVGLAVSTVMIAYYRFIWTASPIIRAEVPAGVRFRKFLYAIVIGVVVTLVLAMIPLLVLPT